ncbi:MAG: hypothetical protein O3A39_07665 [Proteobacteria bacterium]|nr:hypothetical protein [Pseudomonadota bacterium]
MTKYITSNKGTIDKLPTLEKRARYYHNEIKGLHRLLTRTGQLMVDSDDDPDYGIAVDYDVKLGIFGK